VVKAGAAVRSARSAAAASQFSVWKAGRPIAHVARDLGAVDRFRRGNAIFVEFGDGAVPGRDVFSTDG
jgi:hypothetical protein